MLYRQLSHWLACYTTVARSVLLYLLGAVLQLLAWRVFLSSNSAGGPALFDVTLCSRPCFVFFGPRQQNSYMHALQCIGKMMTSPGNDHHWQS